MNSKTIDTGALPATALRGNTFTPRRILFVCLGNICRSPSAQGIFSHLATSQGASYLVDSAGTHDYHVGKSPDSRAIAATGRAGVDISQQRARQFAVEDFERFDHILVMDERNRSCLAEMCPPELTHKLKPITTFIGRTDLDGVPDPVHGEEKDFDDMVRLLTDICGTALDVLEQQAA